MTWINGTTLHPQRGLRLVSLLADTYPTSPATIALFQSCGIPPRLLREQGTALTRWIEMVLDLMAHGLLSGLLVAVCTERPALRHLVEDLCSDDPAQPGNPSDHYDARLVAQGIPIIGRRDLRSKLRNLLEHDGQVLVITGDPRVGKTHSWLLLKHVMDKRHDHRELFHVNFTSSAGGSSASDLLEMIGTRLGLNIRERPAFTSSARHTFQLVNDFVGAYRALAHVPRVMLIDGVNRVDLEPNVHEFIAHLTNAVVSDQLKGLQLVVCGYSKGFDRDVSHLIDTEFVRWVDRDQVHSYLDGIAQDLGMHLTDQAIDELTSEILDGAPDLEVVRERTTDVVRRLAAP